MIELRDHSQPCEHDESWYWEGTQAHKIYQCNQAACPGGREVTDDEITKKKDQELIESLAGRTIVTATWVDLNPDKEWEEHEEATLTLDDGRIIVFGGWGHDASGATVRLKEDHNARQE